MSENEAQESGTSAGGPRVAYVVKRYPRYSETFIVNELLAHQAAGCPVDVFSLRPSNDTHFQDAISRVRSPVTFLPHYGVKAKDFWKTLHDFRDDMGRLETGLASAWGGDVVEVRQAMILAKAVRKRGIDHLHAHFATSSTSVARMAARFAGIGFSFTAHAKDIFHEDVDPAELLTKLSDADAVVTVSDFNESHLTEVSAGSEINLVRIYNGLDLDTFCFESPLERPPHIIAVGRLVEKKGFDILVDACGILEREGVDFECDIIGTGDLEGELRDQIERGKLQHRVKLPGPLAQSDLRAKIQGAAVMAAPCIIGKDGNRDGLPTTLLESMALGTPSVSTDVTGIPEAIRHDETGLIVAQHDPGALAKALKTLIGNPELRDELARKARTLVEDEFNVTVSARRLRAVFADAVGRRAKEQSR